MHETRQRNAELALINSVQDAIAGELDTQAIYDAVGDKIQEIFDAQATAIFTVDDATGLMHVPYMIERGERLPVEPLLPLGFSKHVLETRSRCWSSKTSTSKPRRYGSIVAAGETVKSGCSSARHRRHDRRDLPSERRSRACIQRIGSAAAGDARGSLSVALETRGRCTRRGSGMPSWR